MRYIRQSTNSNTIVGIFLLIVLAVFAGPNALPRLIASFVPFADEGLPCEWLRVADNRERHQSLIGRSASTIPDNPPLSVEVIPDALPSDTAGEWHIRVVLANDSIGTLPVVINPNPSFQDTGAPGLGIVFNTGSVGQAAQPPFQSNVRLLGPRQRCVQRITVPGAQLGSLGINPGSSVTGYYRNSTPGGLNNPGQSLYPDFGLWVGIITSELRGITFSTGTASAQ
jgi:hypothetical protein